MTRTKPPILVALSQKVFSTTPMNSASKLTVNVTKLIFRKTTLHGKVTRITNSKIQMTMKLFGINISGWT